MTTTTKREKRHSNATGTQEMALLNDTYTTTPQEREAALSSSQTQIRLWQEEHAALLDRIAEREQEIAAIEQTVADRRQQDRQALDRLNVARQATEEQESYVSLFSGHAGTQELAALQATQEEAQTAYDRVTAEHATLNDQAHDRIEALRQEMSAIRATLSEKEQSIERLRRAREQLLREHGEKTFAECLALLSELADRDQEARFSAEQAHTTLLDARSAFLKRMAQWPELKRKLEDIYPLSADASTEALEALLQLFDVLLKHGSRIDMPAASMPFGLVSFLREMELSHELLYGLMHDDSAPVTRRREYLANVLQSYRHNLASYAGIR